MSPGRGRSALRLRATQRQAQERARSIPAITFDGSLPVHARREEIAAAVAEHPVVVVSGATGSGKSTQLPKICLACGRGVTGLVAHTQPRRIAAQSLARRLAAEMGTTLGELVGYHVRFDNRSGPRTLVKLVTDGVLLRELERDPWLERYDTIIVDEAHERTLNVDFLLGVCRRLIRSRPELRVIVTSATIETRRFAEFFGNAPVIDIEGRSHPVEVRYRPALDEDEAPESHASIVDAIEEIQTDPGHPAGDILVFLPGERQIFEVRELLARRLPGGWDVLSLYSRVATIEQQRAFEQHTRPRVILATNVAETSLTLPGLRAVVDTGLARVSRYDPRAKIQRLPIEPVSRASAEQRRGRCGREAPGLCLRLYAEEDYAARPEYTEPEIRRTNLAQLILQMMALGLGAPEDFEFVDAPESRLLSDGYRLLQELRAVDAGRRITRPGRQMAALPVDPRVARLLVEASRLGCLVEAQTLAAFLSLADPRERPADRTAAADAAHEQFADRRSDFRTVLNLWLAWSSRTDTGTGASRRWCRERFLSHRRMREWQDLRDQLVGLCEALRLRVNDSPGSNAALHQAVLSGFIGGIGVREEGRVYLGARDTRFGIAPGTPLAKSLPHWIVAASLVETGRLLARMVAQVQPSWIESAGSHLVRRSYTDAEWSPARGMTFVRETVSLYGRMLSSGRRVDFAKVDPPMARRLFIDEALVRRRSDLACAFLERNAALRASVERLEARLRRRDLLAPEAVLAQFYAERIPEDVADTRAFERWWRQAERQDPSQLDWALEDVTTGPLPAFEAADHPVAIDVAGNALPIDHCFDPTDPGDGLTLRVPLPLLPAVSAPRLEWLVPGHLPEKVIALLRGLPRELRRSLVPMPAAATRFLATARLQDGSLLEQLAAFVTQQCGTRVEASAFAPAELPPWLNFRVIIVDVDGRELAQGRDVAALRQRWLAPATATEPVTPWHRTGLRTWDFGDLPGSLDVDVAGIRLRLFPVLRDDGVSVSQHLVNQEAAVRAESRKGIARLASLALAGPHEFVRRRLERDRTLALAIAGAGFGRALVLEVADRAVATAVLGPEDSPLPTSAAEFERQIEEGREAVLTVAESITKTLVPTLEALREVRRQLEALESPVLESTRAAIEAHLDRLFAPGWVRDSPQDWLEQSSKYAQAAGRRATLARGQPTRHATLEAQVAPFDAELRGLDLQEPATTEAPERRRLRWMIEEFRVSLYAQELRTRTPVSARRLERQLDAARREAGLALNSPR